MKAITREKAHLYHQYRLPYSREAVDDLLNRTGPINVVADIGAGTGLLTQHFDRRDCQIYAIEPDLEMRSIAEQYFCSSSAVKVLDACAENTTLTASSIDMIVVGNAYHRFCPEAAIAEFARILKPNGWLAIFSYRFPDHSSHEILRQRLSALSGYNATWASTRATKPSEFFFGAAKPESLSVLMSRCEGWDEYMGASLGAMEAPDRDDPEFAEYVRLHQEFFHSLAQENKICIDYSTEIKYAQPDYGNA